MKCIVFFYDDNCSDDGNQKVFGNYSAKELSQKAINEVEKNCSELGLCEFIQIMTISGKMTFTELMEKMVVTVNEQAADTVIYAYNDLPFLNTDLIKEMISSHKNFKAEYTFADGYPYGLTPEIIDAGCLKLLLEISKNNQKNLGEKTVQRDSFFNLIKTDINSFEIETVLSKNDWRLLRLNLDCENKDHFMQCTALYEKLLSESKNAEELNVNNMSGEEVSAVASKTSGCLKTIPGFYELEISDVLSSNCIYSPVQKKNEQNFLCYEKFEELMKKIADFSEGGVISFSAFGEAFANPDILKMVEKTLSYKNFSVFIETDGQYITEDLCKKLSEIVQNAPDGNRKYSKVMIAVKIDAFTSNTYHSVYPDCSAGSFEKAVESVKLLAAVLPDCVYPQFIRMNQNEEELENFFRYWNEKSNPSNGNLIIQKYNDYAGLLPYCKPADLSPLDRNVCWHLRRDMTILLSGEVPVCHNSLIQTSENSCGNVYTNSFEEIWKNKDSFLIEHMNNNYSLQNGAQTGHKKDSCSGDSCPSCNCKINCDCGKCDEYYTFNF